MKYKFKIGTQVENLEWAMPIGIITAKTSLNNLPHYIVANMPDVVDERELEKCEVQYTYIEKSKCKRCKGDLVLKFVTRHPVKVIYNCNSCHWTFEYTPINE